MGLFKDKKKVIQFVNHETYEKTIINLKNVVFIKQMGKEITFHSSDNFLKISTTCEDDADEIYDNVCEILEDE